jgi:hypothetical protein
MKNLVALSALVFAIAASSFTVKKVTAFYFVYNGGTQSARSSYTQTTSTQSTIPGSTVLAWIKITDQNDIVDDNEFATAFEALDQVNDSNNSLDDDAESTVNNAQLEKQSL